MSLPPSSEDFKELVRSRTDIVGLIAESVTLQPQRGGREYMGLCPFHDDHNPSMRVYSDRQSYRCWVCNEGGDCFSFVMKRERVGFREALEMLALRARLELPRQYQSTPGGAEAREGKNRLYEIVAWAEQEFHEFLLRGNDAEPARRYLRDRGITGPSLAKFRLGYHPRNWGWLLERARSRFEPEQLELAGLVSRRDGGQGYYDYFIDRVLFPIRNAQGKPVAFGGRVLPGGEPQQGPKYWNTPETPLFNKSQFLYALDQARETISKSNTVVVTEGYTDCVMAHQHGLTNFVATLGTALNDTHVTNLKRFARQVVLVYDGDEAGRNATERALPRFLAQEIDLRILTLPGGLDPADFLEQHGPDALRKLLLGTVEAWDQKLRLAIDRHGLDSIDARHRVLEEMLAVLVLVPANTPGGLAGKWLERESIILGALGQKLNLTEGQIRARLEELRSKAEHLKDGTPPREPAQNASSESSSVPLFPARPTRDELAERELLEILFTLPEQAAQIQAKIPAEELRHPGLRQLLEVCYGMIVEGLVPSYERVTARLEDARMKNLAAQIDEHARQVQVTVELVEQTMEYFRRRREARPDSVLAELERETPPTMNGGADDLAKAKLRLAMEVNRERATRTTRN